MVVLTYKKQDVPTGALEKLKELREQMDEESALIRQLESELEEAQTRHKIIVEELIPEAMDSVGITRLETGDGKVIEVEDKIRASLNADRKEQGIEWLLANGFAGVVKHEVTVRFEKGEDEKADELCRLAEKDHVVTQKKKVEPATLSALVREQLSNGHDVPDAYFNVYRQRVAKVKNVRK